LRATFRWLLRIIPGYYRVTLLESTIGPGRCGRIDLVTAARVEAIYLANEAAGPMYAVNSVRAVSGHGLEGDRTWQDDTSSPRKRGPDREVTLIEAEALEALQSEEGIGLGPGESRRNIVTRGVPLNHLVNREFRVGEVVLRGIRLCEPCQHLESLTQTGVLKGLIHRGGLRAQILRDGSVNVGDPVEVSEAS
jgi:MOSC domain-containing protein YiiM